MNYYLAIDIGASSGRHILGWLKNGIMHTQEIYRFSNAPQMDGEHLKWNTERLVQEIVNGLKKAGEIGKIPQTVGIDTWGVDYALLDEKDNAIDGVYCYRDNRTEKTIPLVHSKIPFEKLYEKTGIAFASFNTIYQLYDDLLSGRMTKAKSLLMLPDFLHFKLTGEKKREYTDATTTGLVDASTHTWSAEIIENLGFKKELFKDLSQPSETVGEFTDEIVKQVGYKAKVVLPATHDTASAVLAAPIEKQTPYISSGTWSLLGIEQDKAHTDERARESGYSNEGSIRNTFRFQKNIMGLWIIQQVKKEIGGEYSFAELAELARKNPVDDIFDVNDKKFLAPKSMTKEIYETVGRKLTVGETAYCVFNSLAHDYARSLKALEKATGETYQTLHIIGGGSKNTLLNELTAKYTGKKTITGPTEATAIGNLLMQIQASGEIESVQKGREIIKKSFDIQEIGL